MNSRPVAINGARMIEPSTGEVAEDAVVLIEKGHVTASGTRSNVTLPRDAENIDATGLTLLPGLIDCHVHLCFRGNGVDMGEILGTPPSLTILNSVEGCRRTVDAGFTTVRDAGGTPAGVRMAVEKGYFPGPRMQLAITILSQTGGHADSHFPCGVDLGGVLSGAMGELPPSVVDGVEAMRLRVREILRAGADWIKLCTSGGVLSPGDKPHHATFVVDEIKAAVEQAQAQGKKVMAHAQATAGIRNALIAGVTSIEHGIWIDDDLLELFLDGGNPLIPTLVAPQWVIRHAEEGRMPEWAAEKAREVVNDHKVSIKKAIDAGVKIAFGTDSGVGPHGTNGEEFKLLHQLGMKPIDCLRTATTTAAEVLGLTGLVGTLLPGAYGDLIAVEGNPLDDLDAVAKPDRVRLVLRDGQVVKNQGG